MFSACVVEREKHRGVDGASGVEEGDGDTVHTCDAVFIKGWFICALGDYCTLDSYVGASHLWDECWGRVGVGCCKRSRDFQTAFGL